ncbi:MAG: hypothetical protein ACE5R5_08840 [Nitrosarchaeum sp.]
MLSVSSFQNVFADIIPPKKQVNIGIPFEDIVCESGMVKVIRERTNTIACLKPNNVSKLVSNGWAKSFDEKSLTEQLKEKPPLGKINKLYADPVVTQFGKSSLKSPATGYTFAFEVCAFSQKIYVPDILLKSDSEIIRYEIPSNVEPNSCIISVAFISANDPHSIKATLLNKGDISKALFDLESKISSLQDELVTARQSLGDKASPDVNYSSKILDIRNQINEAKDDLYKLYFILYANPQEKYDTKKISFTGKVVEGESVNLITTKRAINADNTFDVIFEACAGKNLIRLPVITISSDRQTIDVKLGDKISPNACLMTSAKIKATNPDNIVVQPAGNAESNNRIIEIENQMSKLEKDITHERDQLRLLVHDPKRTSNFAEQVEKHSTNLIELRNQILSLKAEYNKILYQTYR